MTTPGEIKPLTVTKYGRSSHWYQTPAGLVPSVTSILSVVGKPALVNWAANHEREMVVTAAAEMLADLKKLDLARLTPAAYITSLTARIGKVKAHVKAVTAAAEIGRQAHKRAEWLIRKQLGQAVGPEPECTEKALWASMVFEDWWRTARLQPRAAEQTVWHQRRGYAGTMDLWGEATLAGLGTAPVVIDIKTGKAIYGEALMQVSAYMHALVAMGHVRPPVIGAVLRLPKVDTDPEAEIRVIPWEEGQMHYLTFRAVHTLWHWQQLQDAAYEQKKNGDAPADPTLAATLEASLAALQAAAVSA